MHKLCIKGYKEVCNLEFQTVTNCFVGAEILLTVSGVPVSSTDTEVGTPVDQSAVGDQMELQVETEIQGDEVTAGEDKKYILTSLKNSAVH